MTHPNTEEIKTAAKGFNEATKAKLAAAGFTDAEQRVGALTAEMHAALRLVDNPLAAMALSSTMSKALAYLSQFERISAQRAVAVSDIVLDAAMGHAKKVLGRDAVLDEQQAAEPKDIN